MLALACLACWIRPTAAVPIGLLGLLLVVRIGLQLGSYRSLSFLLADVLPWLAVGVLCLAAAETALHAALAPASSPAALMHAGANASIALPDDNRIHEPLEAIPLPLWNFISFNMVRGLGRLYGEHGPAWYWLQGLPPVLGPAVLALPVGVWAVWRKQAVFGRRAGCMGLLWRCGSSEALVLLVVGLLSVAVFSLGAHKEHRFLLPLIPFFMPSIGHGVQAAAEGVSKACEPSVGGR